MAITAHFIDNDHMESILLSFNEMTQRHTGKQIAEVIHSVLIKFGIPYSKVIKYLKVDLRDYC
jgi:hypothetical protein